MSLSDQEARLRGLTRIDPEAPIKLRETLTFDEVLSVVKQLQKIYKRSTLLFENQQIYLPAINATNNNQYFTENRPQLNYGQDEVRIIRQPHYVCLLVDLARWFGKNDTYQGPLAVYKNQTSIDILKEWGEVAEERFIIDSSLDYANDKVSELLQLLVAETYKEAQNRGQSVEAKEIKDDAQAQFNIDLDAFLSEQTVAPTTGLPPSTATSATAVVTEVPLTATPPTAADTNRDLKTPTRDFNQKFRYEHAWLYNFTMHQVALQLGISIDQIPPTDQQRIRDAIANYLQNPANLARFYDLKNVDILRAQAFRDIFAEISSLQIKIKLSEDKSKEIKLEEPKAVTAKDTLNEILAQFVPQEALANNLVAINISQEIETAILLKGAKAIELFSEDELAAIIEQVTGVRLTSEQKQKLKKLLNSYIQVRIGEQVMAYRNETINDGVVTNEDLDGVSKRFSYQTITAALTDTQDNIKLDQPETDFDNVIAREGKINKKTYLKYKKMYSFWYGLDREVQKLIITELKKIDPSFLERKDFDGNYLLPYNIYLFNISLIPNLQDRRYLPNEVRDQLVSAAKKVDSNTFQEYLKESYFEAVPEEYQQKLLEKLIKDKHQKIDAERERITKELDKYEQTYFERLQELEREQFALREATLTNFSFNNIATADQDFYREYTTNPEAIYPSESAEMQTAPPSGGRFNFFRKKTPSKIPPVLAPNERKARAITNASKNIKNGVELAKTIGAVGTGNVLALAKDKNIRKIIVGGGLGVAAGAILSYLLNGIKGLLTFGGAFIGGAIGLAVGGPLGMVAGAFIGGAAGAWLGDVLTSSGAISSATVAPTASIGSVASSIGSTITGSSASSFGATALPGKAFGSVAPQVGVQMGGGVAKSAFLAKATTAAAKTASVLTSAAVFAPLMSLSFLAGIVLYTIWVIQFAFLAPLPLGTPVTAQPSFSQYATLTKTPSPNKFDNFEAGQTETVNYTITIAPKAQYKIKVVSVTDTFTFQGKQGEMVAPQVEPLNTDNTHPLTLENFGLTPGEIITDARSASYSLTMTNSSAGTAKDTLVSNKVLISFIAYNSQDQELGSDSIEAIGRVTIGEPSLEACWPITGRTTQLPYDIYSWGPPVLAANASHSIAMYGSDAYDIAAVTGTAVYAPFAGMVAPASIDSAYGNHLTLETDDGRVFVFAHLSAFSSIIDLNSAVAVQPSDIIAYSGSTGVSTGPHLHYELFSNDSNQLPGELHMMVPEPYILLQKPVRSCYDR